MADREEDRAALLPVRALYLCVTNYPVGFFWPLCQRRWAIVELTSIKKQGQPIKLSPPPARRRPPSARELLFVVVCLFFD